MKNRYLLPLGIVTMLFINACGTTKDTPTEESAETVTGKFVDTYVSGLKYVCSSGTIGTTNSGGEYTCNVGDTVAFSLGGYLLGSATASSGNITPETLYPNNPTAELNVARLLQTLDSDPTDDIITIPDNYSDLDNVTTTPKDNAFIATIQSTVGTLVSEEVAQNHLNNAELTVGIKGLTKYYRNSKGAIGSRVYANDGTYTGTFGDQNVSGTYTIKDNNLSIVRSSGNSDVKLQLTYLKTVNEVLKFDISVNGGETFRTYSYFTKALRDAVLTDAIVGKTTYYRNSKGFIGSRVYATDGTYTGTFNGTAVNGTYTIKDNVLSIIRTSGASPVNIVVTYLDSIGDVTSYDISVNGGEVFQGYSYASTTLREAELRNAIVGQTKYYKNSNDFSGSRVYATDGTYTGIFNGNEVSGTYSIKDNILSIVRTSGTSDINLELTYLNMSNNVLNFDVSVNGGDTFQSKTYASASERDAS
ncbi:MAG: Unknown protein [uncultured Sulfurovum sp.]|uniref:Autotransporter adhesin n=1 Tax=uncultured Sulfurovum sp. TaxID=269237 RepID=A0A6S6UA04_9BACT|nr:MAG: Unknown protein [uncultured Sulfurovum sp.]